MVHLCKLYRFKLHTHNKNYPMSEIGRDFLASTLTYEGKKKNRAIPLCVFPLYTLGKQGLI